MVALAVEARNWDRCKSIMRRAREEIEQREALRAANPLILTVAELELPMRIVVELQDMGVATVRDLLDMSQAEIVAHRGFGPGTLQQVLLSLEKLGIGGKKTTLTDPSPIR